MRKIELREPPKGLEVEPNNRYNFTDEQRDQYISEINTGIEIDVRKNAIAESESIKLAGEFHTTPMP